MLYYRPKQVDANGTFSYSPVRAVTLQGAAADWSLFPNPAPGHAATLTGTAPGTAALVLPAGLPAGVCVVRTSSKAMRLTVE